MLRGHDVGARARRAAPARGAGQADGRRGARSAPALERAADGARAHRRAVRRGQLPRDRQRSPAAAATTSTASWRTSCPPIAWSGAAGSTGARRWCRATTSPCAAAPPTPRSGRRWSTPSGWPTTCGCRSCGWSTAPAAAAASSRSRTWATRTSRSSRASSWRPRTCRRCPWSRRRSARWRGSGAARVVASHFSVIVRDTAQLFVAGPPVVARGDGRGAGQGGARRRAGPDARGRGRQRGRRRGRRACAAQALPLLPAVERLGAAADRRRDTTPPAAARSSCSRSCRASGAGPTRCAASSRRCSTKARCSSSAHATAAR